MKKLLCFICSVFVSLLFVINVKADNKVTVYVFYGDGCPHCSALHSYLDTLKEDDSVKDKFDVEYLEVWSDKTNQNILTKVKDYFDTNSTGVPFYVIGDNYYLGYSSEISDDDIVTEITAAYNDENYKDVVSKFLNGSKTSYIDYSMEDVLNFYISSLNNGTEDISKYYDVDNDELDANTNKYLGNVDISLTNMKSNDNKITATITASDKDSNWNVDGFSIYFEFEYVDNYGYRIIDTNMYDKIGTKNIFKYISSIFIIIAAVLIVIVGIVLIGIAIVVLISKKKS